MVTVSSPIGAIDGVNNVFEITNTPFTVLVFWNGLLQALGQDYTISKGQITFTTAPAAGDVLTILYCW